MDLRPYAERLAEAMPERFHLHLRGNGQWGLRDESNPFLGRVWHDHPCCQWWAFFGPLLDEFGITELDTFRVNDDPDADPQLARGYQVSMLKAAAEAVCQAAEAKAKERA